MADGTLVALVSKELAQFRLTDASNSWVLEASQHHIGSEEYLKRRKPCCFSAEVFDLEDSTKEVAKSSYFLTKSKYSY